MADDPTASNFISDTAQELGPVPQTPNDPKVPFQSSLKLTGEQEKKMIEHAFKRMTGISNELGRDQTLQPTWWANLAPSPNMQSAAQGFLQASTFLGKRSRFDATFMNDVSWRPWTMGVDNIFMSSNIVVPLARRICRQMIARAKKSFFGSDPWVSVEPTPGLGDPVEEEQAERIERYARFKLKESNSKGAMGRAIAQALILGECAVKTTYMVRDQIFDAEARGPNLHETNPQSPSGSIRGCRFRAHLLQGLPMPADGYGRADGGLRLPYLRQAGFRVRGSGGQARHGR